MTNGPHMPILAISQIRDPPWVWPARLRGDKPHNSREAMRVLGRMDFWDLNKGYEISDRIVSDALWWIEPTVFGYLVFQHYIKLQMEYQGWKFPLRRV